MHIFKFMLAGASVLLQCVSVCVCRVCVCVSDVGCLLCSQRFSCLSDCHNDEERTGAQSRGGASGVRAHCCDCSRRHN